MKRRLISCLVTGVLLICMAFDYMPYTEEHNADDELSFDSFSEYESYESRLFDEKLEEVADLINSQEDVTYIATYDSWRENLEYLQDHYEYLTQNETHKELVDFYIGTFRYVDQMNDMLNNNNMGFQSNVGNQNFAEGFVPVAQLGQARINAASYGLTNYNTYNPNYPHWPLDCANYISQCLIAGGKTMVGTTSGGGANNMNYWFSYGTVCDATQVSETWRAATGFCIYWMSHSLGYQQFTSAQMANGGAAYNYAVTGDAVSLLKLINGSLVAYHTMIVTAVTADGKVKLCAHTGNECNVLLSAKAASTTCKGCIIYKVFP